MNHHARRSLTGSGRETTLEDKTRLGLRPVPAVDSADTGLLRSPPRMNTPAPLHVTCPGDRCRYQWRSLPNPCPAPGAQPVFHKCRGCDKWWILIYSVAVGPPTAVKLLRVIPSRGKHPERIREVLRGVPEINEDIIELTIAVLTVTPDLGELILPRERT